MARYYLRRNAQCEQPSIVSFVAVVHETAGRNRGQGTWTAGFNGAVVKTVRWDGSNYSRAVEKHCETTDDFWQHVYSRSQRRKVHWLYSDHWHTAAPLVRLWEEIEDGRIRLHRPHATKGCTCGQLGKVAKCWQGLVAIDSSPWIITGDSDYGRLNFVDTANYYRNGITAVGDTSGLATTHSIRSCGGLPTDVEEAQLRCDATAEQMLGLMQSWRTANRGNWQLTAPALAWSNYRHVHMVKPIVIHDDETARGMERDAYYGGQISCWFYGLVRTMPTLDKAGLLPQLQSDRGVISGPVYECDMRSMYASVMRRNLYPTALIATHGRMSVGRLAALAENNLAIARVTLAGVTSGFPWRADGHTIYPQGRYQTTLATPELRRALSEGAVGSVENVCLYRGEEIFNSYVDHWQSQREVAVSSGNSPLADLSKLMLVSLYGRFGRLKGGLAPIPGYNPPCDWGGFLLPRHLQELGKLGVAIGGKAYVRVRKQDHPQAVPSIAAHVTSYGRESMRKVRQHCPPLSCLYQHTDSLIVTRAGLEALREVQELWGGSMGQFKSERPIFQASFSGPNNITVDGETKVAGIDIDAERVGDNSWTVDRRETADESFARGPDGTAVIRRVRLDLPGSHPGMTPGMDGWAEYDPMGI